MQVLEVLLSGSSGEPFLSSAAMDSVLGQLQQLLTQPAASDAAQSWQPCLGALHILQATTFSAQVLLQHKAAEPQLRQAAASGMAACFATSLRQVRHPLHASLAAIRHWLCLPVSKRHTLA